MKLTHLKTYNLENTPDHIIEEIQKAIMEFGIALQPIVEKMPPNIALSAMNFLHCTVIRALIENTDEAIENAGFLEAKTLLMNLNFLHGKNLFFKEKEENNEE